MLHVYQTTSESGAMKMFINLQFNRYAIIVINNV